MYNKILKFVIYLSIITTFFVLLIFSGVFDEKVYYTWVDNKGVTNITENITDVPENRKHTLKKFSDKDDNPQIYNLKMFLKNNTKLIFYGILAVIILIFILFFIGIIRKYYLDYRKRKKCMNYELLINKSGILKLKADDFTKLSLNFLHKMGFETEETDNLLENTIQYIGIKDNKRTAISIVYADIPVSKVMINEIEREKLRFDCSNLIIISNNNFDRSAIKTSQKYECVLIDRGKMANFILKYGFNST